MPTDDIPRTFDWRPPPPEVRAANQPFRINVKAAGIRTDRPLRSYSWTPRVWLDQGQEGACTGFGAAHVMSMAPNARTMTNANGQAFYKGAQRYDEWPGENYEGSSVNGVMSFLLHETKYLTEYWWAESVEEILHAIGYYGPVEMGSVWRTGMMNTRSDGFIHVTGGQVGGHAYSIRAVNLSGKYVTVHNSWGKGWGVNGEAKLSFDDLGLLLRDSGECALPRKTRA